MTVLAATEKILLIVALAHVVAGVGLAMLPLAPSLHDGLVSAIFGADKASEEVKFLASVFGPTVASWGVLLYALLRSYFRHPTRGAWRALVLSIAVWATLDSALCLRFGLYFPVAMNAAIAALVLGLLFRARYPERVRLD